MEDTIIRAIRACSAALEQLAAALEQQSVSEPAPTTSTSWPDIMATSVAAKYCGFKTTGALRKARLEGRVTPAGRRGSRGSLTWARAELDRFMCGNTASTLQPTATPEKRPAKPTSRRPRRMSAETEEALRRIKEIGTRPDRTRR